jgi:basic amino acid/polyamine antiporter, APA family
VAAEATPKEPGETLTRAASLGIFDATTIVAGSMIGSGIFLVSADVARKTGSPGWLLAVWVLAGALTVAAALSYGELAAMLAGSTCTCGRRSGKAPRSSSVGRSSS